MSCVELCVLAEEVRLPCRGVERDPELVLVDPVIGPYRKAGQLWRHPRTSAASLRGPDEANELVPRVDPTDLVRTERVPRIIDDLLERQVLREIPLFRSARVLVEVWGRDDVMVH